MSQLHSLAVNGVSYELPTMNQFTSQLTELGRAMQSMVISAYDNPNDSKPHSFFL